MNSNCTVEVLLENIKKQEFYRGVIPIGFGAGLPIIKIIDKQTYIMIPFFRFDRVNELDKSLIYPIKFQITVKWPSGKLVSFEDYQINPAFIKVDFSKPIGYFRHEAIKMYNSGQYNEKRKELYSLYDKLLNFLLVGDDFTSQDEDKFKELLNMIIEPSLVPIYRVLDQKFSSRFLK